MVAVKLEGRLGNQLFQYAFVYAAAKRLRTPFYLDKSIGNFLLPEYFAVENDWSTILDKTLFSIKGFKNIFRKNLRYVFYNSLNRVLLSGEKIAISNQQSTTDALNQLKNNCLYEGYFQSENYFKDCESEIRRIYQIKKQYVAAFETIQAQLGLSKKKVVIHIRRTDYVDMEWSLPISYYKKAIGSTDPATVDYIFITDDPAYVESKFGYLSCKYISTQSEIVDLQFLINADICILSSSSFSWWGAWLNTKPDKIIYAPKNWLGYKQDKEYPVGISENLNFKWVGA